MDDNKNQNQLKADTLNTDEYQKILDEYAASIKPEEPSTEQPSHPDKVPKTEPVAELKEVAPDTTNKEPVKLKDINSLQLEAPDNKSISAETASQPINIEPPILDQSPKNTETKLNIEPPIVTQPTETLPPEPQTTETKTPEEIKAQIDKIFADDSSSTSFPPSKTKSLAKNFFFLSIAIFFLVAAGWIYFLYFYQQPTTNTNVSTVSPTPTKVVSQETCELNGTTYKVGESFKSADGCNTCGCQTGNMIACTEMACNVTPEVIPATKSAAKTTITPTKSATTSSKTAFQKMIVNWSLYKEISTTERKHFTDPTYYWTGFIKSEDPLYAFAQDLIKGSIKKLTISKTNLSTILGNYEYSFYLTPNYKKWTTDQFVKNTESKMTGIGDVYPLYASTDKLVWTTSYISACGGVRPDDINEQKAQDQCLSLVEEIKTAFP